MEEVLAMLNGRGGGSTKSVGVDLIQEHIYNFSRAEGRSSISSSHCLKQSYTLSHRGGGTKG